MTAIIPRSGSVATRVARPSASKVAQLNSKVAAIKAATSGGNTGTWYSSAKSWTVTSQLAVLVRPAFRNTLAMARRNNNWAMGSGKRPSHVVTATRRTRNPVGALTAGGTWGC